MREFEEGKKILPCEAKSFPSTMGNEIYIFPISWRRLFTKFKSFSSLYISHNLIHIIQPFHSPQKGSLHGSPLHSPTLIPPTILPSPFLEIEARQEEHEDFKIHPWVLFVYFMSRTLIIVLVHLSMDY